MAQLQAYGKQQTFQNIHSHAEKASWMYVCLNTVLSESPNCYYGIIASTRKAAYNDKAS